MTWRPWRRNHPAPHAAAPLAAPEPISGPEPHRERLTAPRGVQWWRVQCAEHREHEAVRTSEQAAEEVAHGLVVGGCRQTVVYPVMIDQGAA